MNKRQAYAPRILKPVLKQQPHNVTAYLVESHQANRFYYVWVASNGSMRCTCRAQSFGNDCCHKQALDAKLTPARSGCADVEALIAQASQPENEVTERVAAAQEPEPDLVAILAEPDLPRSALYFDDDEPVGQCPRCNGNLFWTDADHDAVRCAACQHLMVAAKHIQAATQRLQAERSAKREAACIADHCPETFSVYRS